MFYLARPSALNSKRRKVCQKQLAFFGNFFNVQFITLLLPPSRETNFEKMRPRRRKKFNKQISQSAQRMGGVWERERVSELVKERARNRIRDTDK